MCVPERFRISGNAWVSPTRPSSTLGNVYCKLAGRGWGRKSLQIPCCCRWMLIHNRGVWVCVRGVRSQTDGYGNLETGRPGQTGRVAKGKSGMERVRPFGGWAWKSQCWLSLYSPPPSALSSSSPLPIHISCPFLRWRGWMGAPLFPVSPTQGLATPPTLPIDLPASPTCAPAAAEEETKDWLLPNWNSKLRSCAKLAFAQLH